MIINLSASMPRRARAILGIEMRVAPGTLRIFIMYFGIVRIYMYICTLSRKIKPRCSNFLRAEGINCWRPAYRYGHTLRAPRRGSGMRSPLPDLRRCGAASLQPPQLRPAGCRMRRVACSLHSAAPPFKSLHEGHAARIASALRNKTIWRPALAPFILFALLKGARNSPKRS